MKAGALWWNETNGGKRSHFMHAIASTIADRRRRRAGHELARHSRAAWLAP